MSLRRLVTFTVLASVGLALAACASRTVSAEPAAIALDWPARGKPVDHVDAFQNQVVKVGLITLSGGATMPEHASPLPVLLTATSGRGTVTTASGSYALDPTHAVFLPGGEKHAVTAQEGEALRIAVVALKGSAAAPVEGHGR